MDQNYLRGDTAANALLIEAQSWVPIAGEWGCGMLASVDGAAVHRASRSINTRPSPYGGKRSIIRLRVVDDQVSGTGQMVGMRASSAVFVSANEG